MSVKKHSMDVCMRQPNSEEIPALRRIWSTAFQSDDDELFFDCWYDPELSLAAVCGDDAAAAGYLIPAGKLVSGGASFPCAMIYGVATLPEYRNRGFGASIVKGLIALGKTSGFPAIILCPTEDSLFGYYSARSDLRDWFYIREQVIETAPVRESQYALTQVEPDFYIRQREKLLVKTPHISFDLRTMKYQDSLCRRYGGGFYHYHSPTGASCALVEVQSGGEVWVKELLTADKDGFKDILPGFLSEISTAFPSDRYIVRSPTRLNDSQSAGKPEKGHSEHSEVKHSYEPYPVSITRRYGMLASPEALNMDLHGCAYAPWYGIAFD